MAVGVVVKGQRSYRAAVLHYCRGGRERAPPRHDLEVTSAAVSKMIEGY